MCPDIMLIVPPTPWVSIVLNHFLTSWCNICAFTFASELRYYCTRKKENTKMQIGKIKTYGALNRFFHEKAELVLPVWIAETRNVWNVRYFRKRFHTRMQHKPPPTIIKSIGIQIHGKYAWFPEKNRIYVINPSTIFNLSGVGPVKIAFATLFFKLVYKFSAPIPKVDGFGILDLGF